MAIATDPATYEAWYHTSRGRWIGDTEFDLLWGLLRPTPGESLLDVGCGTGHFSRRFARQGLSVTGIDPDSNAIEFAKQQGGDITYWIESALTLPFPDQAFDYTIAITSFCFINQPQVALTEMWRMTQRTLTLGLLNRHSLLYRFKHGRRSYRGARWDTADEVVRKWTPILTPAPKKITIRTAIFFPQGNRLARWTEACIPNHLPWGGFLVVSLEKSQRRTHERNDEITQVVHEKEVARGRHWPSSSCQAG
jgi:SAM-dependent methyltransferase